MLARDWFFSGTGHSWVLIKHGAFTLFFLTSPVLQRSYSRWIRSMNVKMIGFPPFFTDACSNASIFMHSWGIDNTCGCSQHRQRPARFLRHREGACVVAPCQSRALRDRHRVTHVGLHLSPRLRDNRERNHEARTARDAHCTEAPVCSP